jgi:hypothetical protein
MFILLFNKASDYLLSHKPVVYCYWAFVFAVFLCGRALGAMLFGDNSFILVLQILLLIATIGLYALVILVALVTRSRPQILELVQWNLLAFMFCFLAASLILVGEDKLVDFFRGRPKIVAFYRGAPQRAELTLREDNKFDILLFGEDFFRGFLKGEYELEGETITCRFSSEPPGEFKGRGQIVRTSDGKLHIYVLHSDSVHSRIDFVVRKNYQDNVLQFAPREEKQ